MNVKLTNFEFDIGKTDEKIPKYSVFNSND